MTTYYVSGNVASSGNGSSYATAWKTFANINWANISAGDTIVIDGGTNGITYKETLTVGASGAANNPITIKASTDAGHTGTVTIWGGRTNPLPWGHQPIAQWHETATIGHLINFGNRSYVTLDGSRWHGMHIYGCSGDGISMASGCGHITMRYLEVNDCGSASGSTQWSTDLCGCRPIGNNHLVEYCDFHDCGQDCFQTGSAVSNFTIRKTWLHFLREHPNNPGCAFNWNVTHQDGYQNYGPNPTSNNLLFEDVVFGPGMRQGFIGENNSSGYVFRQCLFLPVVNGNCIFNDYGGTNQSNYTIDHCTFFVTATNSFGDRQVILDIIGNGHIITDSIFQGGYINLPGSISGSGNIKYDLADFGGSSGTAKIIGTTVNPNFVTNVTTFDEPPTFSQLATADFTPQAGAAIGKGVTNYVSQETFLSYVGVEPPPPPISHTKYPLPGQNFVDGVSTWIFGTNGQNYTPNHIYNTPAIQQHIKDGGFPLLRISMDGISDAEIDQRLQASTACGCVPLIVLPRDSPTFAEHCVRYVGSRCLLYEFGNEPDITGTSWQQYLAYWNAQIPLYRSINPDAAFIGPTLGVFANLNSYAKPWLQGCVASGVIPDGFSYHVYPCTDPACTQTQCAGKTASFQNDATSVRNMIASVTSEKIALCLTEWNMDAADPPHSYTQDSAFCTTWTHGALDAMVTAKIDMACQWDAGGGAAGGLDDLVSTNYPYNVRVQYQPMVDKIVQYIGTAPPPPSNSRLVGPDTPLSFTNGTKTNDGWTSQQYSDLKTLGVHWFRWMPYADSIEKSPGVYSWGNLDSVVKNCNSNGINLLLAVLFPPTWGQSGGFPTPAWTLQFAKAMLARYDGKHGYGIIQGIELGNEDYGFSRRPDLLAKTMNYCYASLKSLYPDLIVGPGSNVYRNTADFQTWVNTMWGSAKGNFDYMNVHFYCQNNNSSDPSVDGATFMSFPHCVTICKNAANAAGKPDFPLWFTEFGWPVNCNIGGTSNYVVSPTTQSNYLKYCFDYAKNNIKNCKMSAYTLAYQNWGDNGGCGIGTGNGFSVWQYGYSGNPLPAFTMIKNYPKDWGGGTGGGGTTTMTKNIGSRAKIRTGINTLNKDVVSRARVQQGNFTQMYKDIRVRARVTTTGAGASVYDNFQRSLPQPQWGISESGDAWVQASGTATTSIIYLSDIPGIS